MPNVSLDGINLHYQQAGRGPDVVMVHGLAANIAFWGLQIVPALSKQFRVTTYDLRGHGKSDMPASGYRVGDLADDLETLLDHLGIAQAHLVGHSFGGGVALEFAVAHPERLLSLTLADAVVSSLQPARSRTVWRRWAHWSRKMEEMGIDLPDQKNEDPLRLLEKLADSRWEAARQRNRSADFFVPFGLWNGASRTARQWRRLLSTTTALGDFSAPGALRRENLRRFPRPVLAIYGERSRFLPLCRQLQRNLPDCRTVLVAGGGHFHPVVKPEAFTHGLREFLLSADLGPGALAPNRSGRES